MKAKELDAILEKFITLGQALADVERQSTDRYQQVQGLEYALTETRIQLDTAREENETLKARIEEVREQSSTHMLEVINKADQQAQRDQAQIIRLCDETLAAAKLIPRLQAENRKLRLRLKGGAK